MVTTKKKRKVILLALLLSAVFAHAGTTVLTGTIRDSQGSPLNGKLLMYLPVPAQDPATNTAIAPIPVTFRLVNGAISGGAPLYDVLTINPANLYYIARAYDTAGNLQFYGNYNVTGASYNLGSAVPTSVTTSNISYSGVGFTALANTWTGAQTFLGQINCKAVSVSVVCVDAVNTQAWSGTDAGAWINSADAALALSNGSGIPGTIQVYGVVNATTQITVGVRHTLDIQGAVKTANPILMSDGANIDCHHLRGSGGGGTVNACLVATAGMAQVVRGLTQDGTTEMFTLQRFAIDAGFQTITKGVIDTTGMNDRTTVEDGEIIHWNGTAPAIFIGNAVSNSTSFQQFRNLWINGGGTASSSQPCLTIQITGSGVNGSIIGLTFDHIECTSGGTGTLTQAVLIQNNSSTAVANAIADIYFNDVSLQYLGVTVTDAIKVDTAWNILFKNTLCANGTVTNCLHVTNSTNNIGIVSDNLTWGLGGSITNFILDDLNTITLPVAARTHVPHYEFYNSNSTNAFAVFGTHYSFLETAAPASPVFGAGRDACYGDSTAHALKCSYNNGSFSVVPLVGIANTWTAVQSFGSGDIVPSAAGGTDLGSAALPFGNLWLGTAATNNFKFAPAATAGARTVTIPDPQGATSKLGLNFQATSGTYQAVRGTAGCTTSGGASAFTGPCTTTVTFPTSFPDTNFSVTCMGRSAFTGVPLLQGATATAVNQATVQTQQATGVNASFATIDCIAVHD